MKKIKDLVVDVHEVVTVEGMDLSPSDVGHILSLFFEGLAHAGPHFPALDNFFQRVADECGSVTDE